VGISQLVFYRKSKIPENKKININRKKGEVVMCDSMTVSAVLEVVNDFVKQEKMFTAYDVTKEVRKKAGEQVDYHREIRRVVHGGFDWIQAGYQSTSILLNVPGNPRVLLYHPLGTDPNDFHLALQDDTDDDLDSDVLDGDNTDSTQVAQAPKSSVSKICKVTSEGRLNIPKKVLLKMQDDNGSFDISVNGTLVCRKATDWDFRIRLNSSVLGGAKVGDGFNISADIDKNIIIVQSR
jgi:hypothetical protein